MTKSNDTIKTTAVINGLTVGCHTDKISFTALSLDAEQNEIVTDMVQTESPIKLRVSLPGKADPKFPTIEVEGVMKKYTINKTCDNPNITGIQFSSNQVCQIANLIRAEEKINLTIIQMQQNLPMEQGGKKEE